MRRHVTQIDNEEGFVLITGLMILLVLTLLGLAATTNTTIELQIAGNDRLHKQTLYQAEGGAIMGTEILEQNFNCTTGFAPTGGNPWADLVGTTIRAFEREAIRTTIALPHPSPDNAIAFWRNADIPAIVDLNDPLFYVGRTWEADVAYNFNGGNLDPNNDGDPSDAPPDTGYLYITGATTMLPGGSLQMAAGYEGKGKGAGSGGVAKIMGIYSQFSGALNSESIILVGWRHLVGSEGDCIY